MKKTIFLASLGAAAVAAAGFILFLIMIAGVISNTQSASAETPDSPIPCTITGTRSGDDLELILSYDGMEIKGIVGTVSGSGKFSASKKTGSGKTKMALPTASGARLDVQTFMCYTAVTATGSDQYKLLNSAAAKDDGIYRKVRGRYAIALGSFYGTKIGTEYTIEFKQKDGSKKMIPAILGDCKADQHTDPKHQYHSVDGSVVEFVTAKGTSVNISATQNRINQDFGTVTAIYRGDGSSVEMTGTIKGESIIIEGSVDGIPLSAQGSIKSNKIDAAGFIGENAADAGGGIYSGGKFAWPVPGHTRLSCDYGPRICPFHGSETHSGIDIPAPYGTKVVAAADGTVVTAGNMGSYGNGVLISHGSALFTLYGHNSSLLVKRGQKVKKGQPIALVGSTGASTGNHSHFEVRKGGDQHANHTSPWTYLKK